MTVQDIFQLLPEIDSWRQDERFERYAVQLVQLYKVHYGENYLLYRDEIVRQLKHLALMFSVAQEFMPCSN